jgi:hypothetical protein
MLMLFWIPILIRELKGYTCVALQGLITLVLVALLWAFAHGVRIAMHSVRTMGPLRALLRL